MVFVAVLLVFQEEVMFHARAKDIHASAEV